MKVRVLGGGWFGCHIAKSLIGDGHDVQLHETGSRLFGGASGNNPARLHAGFHYPRSHATRSACRAHYEAFMAEYGFLTASVPVNLYAVASDHSMVDFGTYRRIMDDGAMQFLDVEVPREFGLRGVEGALQVRERHIYIDSARRHFTELLSQRLHTSMPIAEDLEDPAFDLTIDCTFCANDEAGIDRYEPCLVLLMRGPVDKAVTIMDGPFPSLYPWNEGAGLCSLSSAKFTPFSKECRTMAEARGVLDGLGKYDVESQGRQMVESMRNFYPAVDDYDVVEHRLSIRAMPLSAADTRLVDVVQCGRRLLRVRAGKIDAIIAAESAIRRIIEAMPHSGTRAVQK